MKVELVCFRLMLLIFVVSVALPGALAVQAYLQASDMHAAGIASRNKWESVAGPCQDWQDKADGSPKPEMCDHDSVNSLFQASQADFAARDNYLTQFSFFRSIAFLVPLCTLFLFYALRWAITGRIRPLLIKGGPNHALNTDAPKDGAPVS